MPTARRILGWHLTGLLKSRGVSQHELARRIRGSQGNVQAVVAGRRRIPTLAIDRWADAIGLKDRERRTFRLLALASAAGLELEAFVAEALGVKVVEPPPVKRRRV